MQASYRQSFAPALSLSLARSPTPGPLRLRQWAAACPVAVLLLRLPGVVLAASAAAHCASHTSTLLSSFRGPYSLFLLSLRRWISHSSVLSWLPAAFSETTIGYSPDDFESAQLFQSLFDTPWFRVNAVADVSGVEICGALKNVIALAAGFVDGLGYGSNTKAAILRIGIYEMRKFSAMFYSGIIDEVFWSEEAARDTKESKAGPCRAPELVGADADSSLCCLCSHVLCQGLCRSRRPVDHMLRWA